MTGHLTGMPSGAMVLAGLGDLSLVFSFPALNAKKS